MATINMHMKFEIAIPKQTWLMLRKQCRLQTDGQTDKVNPVYPPSNFVGRGYNNKPALVQVMAWRRSGDKPLPEPMLTQFTDVYMRN